MSVLWASYAYRSTVGDAAGVSRGAGMADDPASRLVHFALSRHLLDNGDAEGWSEVNFEEMYCLQYTVTFLSSRHPHIFW